METKQRNHNPKTRRKHPLAIILRDEVFWTHWRGSKEHLLERKRCDAMPPESHRDSVRIHKRSYTFRPSNVCVGCYAQYAAEDSARRERINPARAPRLNAEDRPQVGNVIATEFGEIVARRVDAVVNEETAR